MAVNLSPVGGVAAQFFTNTGAVLTGGKLYTYAAGTTTPAVTYTSGAGSVAWANPIVLDAAGRVSGSGEIWLTDGVQYKFVLKDTNDVLIATYDNITGINSNFVNFVAEQEIQTATAGQTVFTLTTTEYQPGTNTLSVFVDGVNQYGPGAQYAYTETSSTVVTFTNGLHVGAVVKFTTSQILSGGTTSSSLVTYTAAGTGAVTTTVQARLRQTVSVKDFGAVGDGVTNDTAAMAAAHATGSIVYYPAGTYLFTKLSTAITSGGILGDGPTETVLYSTDTSSDSLMVFNGLWLNSATTQTNNAFVFRDFAVTATTPKTAGACIEVTAPIVGSQQENQITVFDNVLCRNFATGIYFKSASFWKVLNCNFIDYRVAGIQVANIYNSDSGDGMITNCLFETNPVSAGNAGILQNSSGGLKITGCKFLGASYGYRMAWTGASSSNLQVVNNSFELMDTFAISLSRTSGTATFSLINITGNNFALSGFHIGTDSNTWLSKIAVTGNIFELWAGYVSVVNSIGLNNVNNLIISGNTFIGAGVTSVAVSLLNPTNGQIGLNNYFGITTPVSQSGAVNVPVALTEQIGSAVTSSVGWTSYGGSLYQSTLTSVTFAAPYLIVPDPQNIQLTAGDGSGTVAGIVGTATTTGFTFRALNVYNDRASTIYWSVKGYI